MLRDGFEPTASPPTILLVDDQEALCSLLAAGLCRRGWRVLTAESAEAAEAIFRRHRSEIQLLLADLRIPDLHGTELVTRLRRLRPRLPVVFMSGDPDERPIDVPHSAFLEKPFSLPTLQTKMHALLGEPSMSGSLPTSPAPRHVVSSATVGS